MIHTRFFFIVLIILGCIASCQDQPDNLSIKENHANIKSRSLAISKDEAIDLVKQKILGKDTSNINVFISNTIIEENDTIQRYLSGNSIIKSSCWFFFVDDNPMENWSHPCRYIYVTMNGEFSIEHHFFPPKMENMTKIISSSTTPYTKSNPLLSFQQINSPKAITNLHNKHALIINGGINKENNHLRYWNNCSAFYSALTKIYGYSKSNITTLMADGQNPEKDRNLNNGEYDSTPLDLDGDGNPDINSSATRSSVISSLQKYAELLTQEDDLTIFITSHGGQINSETYTFALWNDITGMTSDELANLLNNINARCINIILTTCRSGGFIKPLSKENRNVYTACKAEENSYGRKGNWYDYFAYYWISGISGYQPDNNKRINSDYNCDNKISFAEAFQYITNNFKSDKEHAQSSSIPENLENRVSLASYDYNLSINGPMHFNYTCDFSIANLRPECSINNWEVITYRPSNANDGSLISEKKNFNTTTITLKNENSSASEYYEIKAIGNTPDGPFQILHKATSNSPSPNIGQIYWNTDSNQYGITSGVNYGNTLYISSDLKLNLEYTDKAGNKSGFHTADNFRFNCVTSANRYLNDESTFTLYPEDCEDGILRIYATNSCGRSEHPFIINCEITAPYYKLINDSIQKRLSIKVINPSKTQHGIKSILTIKKVNIYDCNNNQVYSKDLETGNKEFTTDISKLKSGNYIIYISDGITIVKRNITIN